MKGRKPNLTVVSPKKSGGAERLTPEEIAAAQAENLRPASLTEEQAEIWDEIAPELALLGRLKAHYRHTAHEYVVALARLWEHRRDMAANGETYEIEGRNGTQQKNRPVVGQYNETWRQWRNLAGALGLTPQDERALGAAARDLFDDIDPAREFV